MNAYQQSVQDVDAALRRLNATLESYKLSTTSQPAATAPSPRPLATPSAQPAKPTNGVSNDGDMLRERPWKAEDELWREVLELRCWQSDVTPRPRLLAVPAEQAAIDRQLDSVSKIRQLYLIEYPYLVPLRILLAQKYLQLGYPDLAAGEAYKALLLCDAIRDDSDHYQGQASTQLREVIQQIPLVERIRLLKLELGPDGDPPAREGGKDMDVEVDFWIRQHYLPWIYRLLALGLLRCGCYKSAWYYADLGLTRNSRRGKRYLDDQWLLDCMHGCQQGVMSDLGLDYEELKRSQYWDEKNYPDQGYVRREVYPWNEWEPDRVKELSELNAMMAEVAPKLEVRAVELPALTGNGEDAVVTQVGIFAKEDITPGEIVLHETSMLTANNRLQDALCDACNADLPGLDSASASEVRDCPHCEAVFCSQACLLRAEESYHSATCGADLDARLRDVPPAEAADSLYTLLLLRAIAMAEVQECHPLELGEVKYIWGDFHKLPSTSAHFKPFSVSSKHSYHSDELHGGFLRTLPFSFEQNIRLPLQTLEKMEIDPFAEPNYDLWVFNTLYAKFRGTASARLSGAVGGRKARGPEVSAVHPMWCLANHSCDPNVGWEWGGSIQFKVREERVRWRGMEGGKGEARANTGIRKGEEVLNHYCDVDLPVKERREWARGALGGDCMCGRCVWEAGQEAAG